MPWLLVNDGVLEDVRERDGVEGEKTLVPLETMFMPDASRCRRAWRTGKNPRILKFRP